MLKVLLFSLLSSFTTLHATASDLSGTYVGCAKTTSLGDRQMVFHLIKLQTGLDESEFQYSAAFSLLTGSAIYFPKVLFNSDGNKLFMRTDIKPLRDFGMIINTLEIDVLPDGSLSGAYKTNSMTGSGVLLGGTWTANKVAGDSIPKLTCE